MYSFNNILVVLDYSKSDKQLTKMASFLAEISRSKNVHFINVVKDLNLPQSIKNEFPDMVENAIKDRKNEIEIVVNKYFDHTKSNFHIDICSGVPIKVILKYSKEKDIDLILAGRKEKELGGGALVNRLARRAECSLMIVPNKFKSQINKILVPIDYSNYSKNALRQAIDLAELNLPHLEVLVQNVYQVPNGYSYTGKSFDEFADIMKENSMKDYGAFMKDVDTKLIKVNPIFSLDKEDNIIAEVYKAAIDNNTNAIIIGAKGISAPTAIFIGSSAEKLIHIDNKIPLMIVRNKTGKQKGIMDVIREI
jgi:nucleotide-binding universal stress UspA family protein